MDPRARQQKSAHIQGPQHHSDVGSGVVAVMRSRGHTGPVSMIPTTRKLAGIRGMLQCKTAAHSDYAPRSRTEGYRERPEKATAGIPHYYTEQAGFWGEDQGFAIGNPISAYINHCLWLQIEFYRVKNPLSVRPPLHVF